MSDNENHEGEAYPNAPEVTFGQFPDGKWHLQVTTTDLWSMARMIDAIQQTVLARLDDGPEDEGDAGCGRTH